MERPQIVDEGTAPNMEGDCEYIQLEVADSRQGVVFQLGVWASCKQLFTVKVSGYEMFTQKASHLN